jgi:hypothetical protein
VATAQRDPRRILGRAEAALVADVGRKQRPEVRADRHPMLVAGALQRHNNHARRPVQVAQAHPEHAVAAVHI